MHDTKKQEKAASKKAQVDVELQNNISSHTLLFAAVSERIQFKATIFHRFPITKLIGCSRKKQKDSLLNITKCVPVCSVVNHKSL